MSHAGFIARQPIVTSHDQIFGYELLFRTATQDGTLTMEIDDDKLATAKVAVNALNNIGTHTLVGDKFAFLNVDKELLLDEIVLGIPKERFVLELPEDVEIDESLVERVKELKSSGYSLALDNATCDNEFLEKFKILLPLVSYIKLDTSKIALDVAKEYMENFKKFNITFLASKVESMETFEYFDQLGCEYFQGYFFAKPVIVEGKVLDPAFKSIFKLINLLGKDADIDEISLEFERSPKITLQLLKFMNSGQLPLKQKIRSIAHAIALLGKDPLKYWLLLMAFAHNNDGEEGDFDSPLLVLAQTRSKLMSEIMKHLKKEKSASHEAAMVGTLSLIDVITKTSMETILAEVEVAQEIKDALLDCKGDLGAILELSICMEEFDFGQANILIDKLGLTHEIFQEVLANAYK